jgi:hypothetical protein
MNVIPYRKPYPGTQPEYLHPTYTSSVRRSPTQPSLVDKYAQYAVFMRS